MARTIHITKETKAVSDKGEKDAHMNYVSKQEEVVGIQCYKTYLVVDSLKTHLPEEFKLCF